MRHLSAGGARVEFMGVGGAPQAGDGLVEAKFYGDGTWNKAVLGAALGPDQQQVKFVGYEDDGWQDTHQKDIRYPAVKLAGPQKGRQVGGPAKATGATDSGQSAAAGGSATPTATPTKAQEKKAKDGKAGKGGRSGKKWEVVGGFMDAAIGSGGGTAAGVAGKSAKAEKKPPAGDRGVVEAGVNGDTAASSEASSTANPTKSTKGRGDGRAGANSGARREVEEAGGGGVGGGGGSGGASAAATAAAAEATAAVAAAAVAAAAAALSTAASSDELERGAI